MGKFYVTLREWSLGKSPCTSLEHSYENVRQWPNETLKGTIPKFVVSWDHSQCIYKSDDALSQEKRLTMCVVAECNGFLMALMVKTHVRTKRLLQVQAWSVWPRHIWHFSPMFPAAHFPCRHGLNPNTFTWLPCPCLLSLLSFLCSGDHYQELGYLWRYPNMFVWFTFPSSPFLASLPSFPSFLFSLLGERDCHVLTFIFFVLSSFSMVRA